MNGFALHFLMNKNTRACLAKMFINKPVRYITTEKTTVGSLMDKLEGLDKFEIYRRNLFKMAWAAIDDKSKIIIKKEEKTERTVIKKEEITERTEEKKTLTTTFLPNVEEDA